MSSNASDKFCPAQLSYSRLLLRESEPLNLESPFSALGDRLTPTELFYLRSHFPSPAIDPSSWRLVLRGTVRREMRFSLDELRSLPPVTRTVTLECAGNGRILLSPQARGVQWHLGAVGTAEWTGVPLASLLDAAGLSPGSEEIVFEGADRGVPKEPPHPLQPITYAHSVPAGHLGDVLLAYAMNGQPLAREHGFPLRAVVSGYYAMASVKWLTRIHVLNRPFQGYFQTTDYAFWDEMDGLPVRRPLSTMALKSQIARPVHGQVFRPGDSVLVAGAAWTGAAPIEHVEVSTDGGLSWHPAQFLDPHEHGVWRRWEWRWQVPMQPGSCALISRAIDRDGQIQPASRDPRFGSYRIHHITPVIVTVRP
jgi:DMSO/TMAO reductase YedYZ molybdopterin-dependent catalytic subunit